MAPEFYDNLPCYHSYITEVFLPYITNPALGVYARIKRKTTQRIYDNLAKTTDTRKYAPYKVLSATTLIGAFLFIIWAFVFSGPRNPITIVQALGYNEA